MKWELWLMSLWVLGGFSAMAQSRTAIVEGKCLDYANHSLVFEALVNPISDEKVELAVIQVGEDGRFYQEIALNSISYVSCALGHYNGHIYLEPGQSYELVFPPFKPLKDEERFSPYFVPEDIAIGIVNAKAMELNRDIALFDGQFQDRFNHNARLIFAKGDSRMADAIMAELDSLFPAQEGSYFGRHKHYRYGELKALAYKRQERRTIEEVFGGELNIQMPAFQKTFNLVFKDFFAFYLSSAPGKSLKEAFGQKGNFTQLVTAMQTDTLFADAELAGLVLLKSLYDAFYTKRLNEERVIQLFSDAAQNASTPQLRAVADGLYRKVNWLRAGSEAPAFTLYRSDGKERSLSDYRGKFVYLNFIHSASLTCRQDLQLLDRLSQELKKDLTLLTIVVDEDPERAYEMAKVNRYKWDFLHYALNSKIILNYNIKAIPMYYLIDPDGVLRLSPAPAPEEQFGPAFLEAMRKYTHEKWRKDKPKEKSIFDFN